MSSLVLLCGSFFCILPGDTLMKICKQSMGKACNVEHSLSFSFKISLLLIAVPGM